MMTDECPCTVNCYEEAHLHYDLRGIFIRNIDPAMLRTRGRYGQVLTIVA